MALRGLPPARASIASRAAGPAILFDGPKRGQQFAVRQRLEPHDLAARTDGRQQPPERMRNQQEQRARRRFLEVLQQRVGSVDVHVVGRIDDDDAIAAVMRGERQEAADPPDLVHGQRGLEGLGLFVERPRQVQHPRVRAARDLPIERGGRILRQEAFRRAVGRPMRKQIVRQLKCSGRLADAARPGEHQRVRQFCRAVRGGEVRNDRVMPEQLRDLRWLGNAVERIVLLGCDAFVHAIAYRAAGSGGVRLAPRSAATTAAAITFSTWSARATHR